MNGAIVRWLAIAALGAVACSSTPDAPAPPPPEPAVIAPAAPPVVEAPSEPPAWTEPLPFRWYLAAPARGVPSVGATLGAGTSVGIEYVGEPPRLYDVAEHEGGLTLRRRDAEAETWSVAITGELARPVVARKDLEADGVLVAAVTPTGWWLERRNEADGIVRWTTHGEIAGVRGVQIDAAAERIVVNVWRGDDAPVIDVVDPDDGRVIGRRSVDAWFARDVAAPAGAIRATTPSRIRFTGSDGATYRARVQRSRAGSDIAIVGTRPDQSTFVAWSDRDPFGCTALALAELPSGGLVIARGCPAASGASVHVADPRAGTLLWEARAFGIGSIGHSAYGNAIAVAVRGDDVVLYGDESGGRYAATYSRAGEEIATLIERH